MKKKFSVEQIVSVLKQAEVGVPIAELIRKVGITEQTYYRFHEATLVGQAWFNSSRVLFCCVLTPCFHPQLVPVAGTVHVEG